ncbi:MAG TPA: diacylglycerol kinase family protein [Acetobacteraceae bacterium]
MLVIFNPVAGRRRVQLLWRVLDVLIHNGIRLEVAETKRRGDAQDYARNAAAAGAPLIVAAGGDGTIAEVASGLIGSDACLGIIPLGTANVVAHELGLPSAPTAIAAALAFGRLRCLWPGRAENGSGERLFVQMLGVGFDAHVVHRLPPWLKRAGGRGAYVAQTLRELGRYRFPPIRLRLDGYETDAASVIISKGRFYGGRFLIAPDARPCEPGFSVLLFDHSGPGAALLYGAALPMQVLSRGPGLRHRRARRIEFVDCASVPAQADGDAAGLAPLHVSDADRPIRVLVGG